MGGGVGGLGGGGFLGWGGGGWGGVNLACSVTVQGQKFFSMFAGL